MNLGKYRDASVIWDYLKAGKLRNETETEAKPQLQMTEFLLPARLEQIVQLGLEGLRQLDLLALPA